MNLKMPNSKSVGNLDGLRVSVSFKNIPKKILPASKLHPLANFVSDEWLELSILENGLMTECITCILDRRLWSLAVSGSETAIFNLYSNQQQMARVEND